MFAASKSGGVVASSGDPYWTSVSLLTNFENNLTFQDGSTNNFAITRTGVVNPSLNTPFSGGVGGSEYFNGSTGYLTHTQIACSGAFTAECWVYSTAPSAGTTVRETFAGSTFNTQFTFNDNGAITVANGGVVVTGLNVVGTSVVRNQWNHLAFVRSGTTLTCYVNGTSVGSGTTSAIAYFDTIGRVQWTPTGDFLGFMSNMRIVNGTAVYTANFTPPTAPLTAITNTSLLITGTGQGMFNNSTFVDQGPNALAITATGSPVYSGRSPFGNTYAGSVLFNGASRISATNNAALQLGSGNFTIECWFNLGNVSGTKTLVQTSNISFGDLSYAILVSGTSCVYYLSSTGAAWDVALGVSIGTVAANTWYHVALVRNGTTITPYLNGVAGTSTTSSATLYAFASAVCFGGYPAGIDFLTGNISNARIVKGTAVYTANFTPSTTPLTAITNTSLLVRGDTGAFYDLSNNGNGMTSTGATAVTTQVKKYGAESASYTATSYQTATDAINLQLGTGDYTIEAWVYRNAAGVLHSLICKGAAATGWLLQVNSSNQLVFTVTATAILTSTTTIAATTWTFVTVTRSGTSTRLFVGGNLEATATDSTNFNQTNALLVGADRSNANGLNGYLDDIRITKGVARYTANFTPPTVTFPTGP